MNDTQDGREDSAIASTLDRRTFIRASIGIGLGATAVLNGCRAPGNRVRTRTAARAAHGGPMRLAIIGVAGQGGANLDAVKHEHIVALCDVDLTALDAAAKHVPGAVKFRDFRALLTDTTLDLDGVVISTPDHTHAPAAAMALRRGYGVYLEKPLTHSIETCRTLARLARTNECVTQMGTLIHAGGNHRRVVEAIQSGVIGSVTQVDCWCPKSWCCGTLTPGAVPPPQLDWNLWQGPIPFVDYIADVHPANWRRYWSYGTGTLGDMGCHILDLPMWALGLDEPRWSRCSVTAAGPPVDAIGCPAWLEATWVYPRPSDPDQTMLDPLVVRWFDGGRVPPTVQELGAKDRTNYFDQYMVCFQGTKGFLFANYDEMRILMAGDSSPPPRSIADSPGHHREWLNALRTGTVTGDGAPLCRFEYAAPLTEMVLLGTVAYRSGTTIEWDRERGLINGTAATRALLREPYRDSWGV